ncbi:nitrate reductase [NADPH] [Chaetomidium leptoderma]|uniref:Nitrate reductase n=1 Tax=Chaetomidium leptoderma TaxID=669021 RepID=A0AAN6VRU2_9PEZI|nr:nitrate reductase [NADPH] [Chaetomidium leptoderma]
MEVVSLPTPSLDSSPIAFYPHFPPTPPIQDFDEFEKPGFVLPTYVDGSTRLYPLPPTPRAAKVLPEDLKTPDNHVERDPRLIRLTGVHPFNVEAPLSDLYDEGFLTTKDLHYVRNHGAVPRVEDAEVLDWEFTIEGMVSNPIKLTLRELIQTYDQVTYPITLVCAGNRRKEQNIVRKTKGFSWGAAGVSTALWTGVALPDLLARAMPTRGAKYVCFEGADKLPNGYYGTSVKLNWAQDPDRGMMVAHGMNGEPLHPDHGKPLRIVIPGQIGGRSVKWLKRIIVTAAPSDNWYHIYDNRVLPMMISPEDSANLPDTWKDERYAIYDLNTNSAICYPAHGETVPLTGGGGGAVETYKLKGYAYAGGGKRVTRLEVTLDQGRTWMLAPVSYPEDLYRLAPDGEVLFGGRLDMAWRESCFCWCFWEIDLPLSRLQEAGDVMIRAMDDSMMVQPRDMYWSVLGMMNNPWYRVVIHKEAHSLRFEHPTQPALMPGGWMERVKKEGGNITNGFWGEKMAGEDAAPAQEEPAKEISMVDEKVTRTITVDEFREHSSDDRPWFVVNGQVYDGTKFLDAHPGGATSITNAAGQDISEEFLAIHSENAKAMMPTYHIGTLPLSTTPFSLSLSPSEEPTSPSTRVFLHPKTWRKALLSQKSPISPDTKIFTFSLPASQSQSVGLPVGQHLLIRLRDPVTREAVIRAYTPLPEDDSGGALRVLIKVYKEGKMTRGLDSLPLGHAVEFKGPVGKFEYLGGGRCSVNGKGRRVRRFVMVCGGSGITPVFAVLGAVVKEYAASNDSSGDGEAPPPECVVLDGNRVEGDILLREELGRMEREGGGRCRVVYTLSQPDEGWTGLRGRMDRGLFEREVGAPPEERDTMVLVCGPEGMERGAREAFLGMGWAEEDLLFF